MDRWTIGRAWIVGGGLLWLAVALVTISDPTPPRKVWGQGLLGFVVGVAWVIYSLGRPGVFAAWRRAVVWLTVPLCLLVAFHADRTDWPLSLRVWLCESELRERAKPGPIDPFEHVDSHKTPPKRIGLFRVRSVWARPDGAVVFVTDRVCVADHGIVYAPDGVPGRFGGGRVNLHHLYGPWYRYAMSD